MYSRMRSDRPSSSRTVPAPVNIIDWPQLGQFTGMGLGCGVLMVGTMRQESGEFRVEPRKQHECSYRRADGRYFVITRTSPQRAHAKVRANAFCARRTIARSHRHRSLNLDMVILRLVWFRLARFANAPPTNRSLRPVMLVQITIPCSGKRATAEHIGRADRGVTYCPAHERQAERQRGTRSQRGYDTTSERWRRHVMQEHSLTLCGAHHPTHQRQRTPCVSSKAGSRPAMIWTTSHRSRDGMTRDG